MAKVTTCDRCGCIIDNPRRNYIRYTDFWDDEDDADKLSDSYFLTLITSRNKKDKLDLDDDCPYDYYDYEYDLCEDCRDSLYKWLMEARHDSD